MEKSPLTQVLLCLGLGLGHYVNPNSGGVAACASFPSHVRVRVPVDAPAGTSPARDLYLGPARTSGLPDEYVVSTLCTQTRARLKSPVLGLPRAHRIICAINGYFIYIVRIVPLGLFTPTSGCPSRSVWTGDYTNGWGAGRGEGGAAGNGAPGHHAGWAWREDGAGLSRA